MKISAVLACHNEEEFIEAWLEETCAYADEILIAIHAPTDSTADKIAAFKPHSPVPIHCEWFPARTVARYGFSLMKNEMIARAAGDWVTSIDADEEIGLTREGLIALFDHARSRNRSAVSLEWAECPPSEQRPDGWTMEHRKLLRQRHVFLEPPVRKWKIFQNHAGFWWEGLIHEEIKRGGKDASHFGIPSGAPLHHYAYLRPSVPEWKEWLYAYLICRIRDAQHLRAGTNSWWYEEGFLGNEQAIRAAAAAFAARQSEWFPHVPRRVI